MVYFNIVLFFIKEVYLLGQIVDSMIEVLYLGYKTLEGA